MLTLAPADIPRSIPKWKATILVADDGTVYVPLMLCPSGEGNGLLFASQDGEELKIHRNHSFVRLKWLAREYPEEMEKWQAVKAMVEKSA